jgi:O-antigen/teichoic acid export membrane protein
LFILRSKIIFSRKNTANKAIFGAVSTFNKNILYSYSTQIVVVLSNFACSILAARMLGSVGQGQLGLYTNFMAFLTLLVGLGIPSALVFYIASGKLKREHVFSLLLAGTLIPLALIGFVLFILHQLGYLTIFLPEFILSSATWLYVLAAHLCFMIFNSLFQAILQAENEFKKSGIISAVGSLILVIVYALKYYNILDHDIEAIHWIILGLLSVSLVQIVFYKLQLFAVNPIYFQLHKIDFTNLKPILMFSGLAYMANLVQFLNYKMDVWLINYYHHNDSMIGIYVLSVSLAQLIWLLPGALHTVLFSFISSTESMKSKLAKTQQSAFRLLIYGIVAGILGYLLSIFIVPSLYGKDFSSVSSIILILLFGIVPIASALAISAFFAGIQKIKVNLYGSIIGLIVCLIFDVLLLPNYGIKGAAWATVFSYNATVLYYVYMFYRYKQKALSSRN